MLLLAFLPGSLWPFPFGCPVAPQLFGRWMQPRAPGVPGWPQPDAVALEQRRAACAPCEKNASAAAEFSLEGKTELRGMQAPRCMCRCQLRAGRSWNTDSTLCVSVSAQGWMELEYQHHKNHSRCIHGEHQKCAEPWIFQPCSLTKIGAGVLTGVNCLALLLFLLVSLIFFLFAITGSICQQIRDAYHGKEIVPNAARRQKSKCVFFMSS